jgi:hypothetical protein
VTPRAALAACVAVMSPTVQKGSGWCTAR